MNWRQFKKPLDGKKVDKVEKPPTLPPFSTFSTLFPAEAISNISGLYAKLDRLGSWEGIRTNAATACPELLEAARAADAELDETPSDPQALGVCFDRWGAVWLACQSRDIEESNNYQKGAK